MSMLWIMAFVASLIKKTYIFVEVEVPQGTLYPIGRCTLYHAPHAGMILSHLYARMCETQMYMHVGTTLPRHHHKETRGRRAS